MCRSSVPFHLLAFETVNLQRCWSVESVLGCVHTTRHYSLPPMELQFPAVLNSILGGKECALNILWRYSVCTASVFPGAEVFSRMYFAGLLSTDIPVPFTSAHIAASYVPVFFPHLAFQPSPVLPFYLCRSKGLPTQSSSMRGFQSPWTLLHSKKTAWGFPSLA